MTSGTLKSKDDGILRHARLREIESRLVDMRDDLEERRVGEVEIEELIDNERKRLMEQMGLAVKEPEPEPEPEQQKQLEPEAPLRPKETIEDEEDVDFEADDDDIIPGAPVPAPAPEIEADESADPSSATATTAPTTRPPRLCYDFMSARGCRFGSRCKFLHDESKRGGWSSEVTAAKNTSNDHLRREYKNRENDRFSRALGVDKDQAQGAAFARQQKEATAVEKVRGSG